MKNDKGVSSELARSAKKPWVKPVLKTITAGSAEAKKADENVFDGSGMQKS